MKLSVFPSSMETARSLIFHLVDIMNAEPDKTFNIAEWWQHSRLDV